MNENLEYAIMFARFPFAVRRFLKHRITLDDAKRIVRERMEQREANLLLAVTRGVYHNPSSPYLALLKHAGCELGDFRDLVTRKGVDPALRQLREAGVYVTYEEFKGRKPIERSGLTLPTRATDFDNPQARRDLRGRTSGSTGAAVKFAIDLDYIAARASQRLLALAAHGLIGVPSAYWRGILPDRTIGQLLAGALTDTLPMRWFSPIGLRDSGYLAQVPRGILLPHRLYARGGDSDPMAGVQSLWSAHSPSRNLRPRRPGRTGASSCAAARAGRCAWRLPRTRRAWI